MARTVVLLLLGLAALAAADVPSTVERWWLGTINGQPSLSLSQRREAQAGGWRERGESTLAIERMVAGRAFRFELRTNEAFETDAEGRILAFRLESDENGQRIAAEGGIAGGTATAAVQRQGRRSEERLEVPEGVPVMAPLAAYEALAKAKLAKGAIWRSAAPALLQGRLVLVVSTATAEGPDADGSQVFSVDDGVTPAPARLKLSPRGEMLLQKAALGPFQIEIRPAAGPGALLGARLDADRLATAAGPVPPEGPMARYRLPPGVVVPEDAFQSMAEDVVTVRAEAAAAELTAERRAALTATEAQLEFDDPELRAWAATAVAGHGDGRDRVEALRAAVRALLASDLGSGDASALEAFRNRKGDCTEHANLLCAALRSIGIPAEVQTGLVWIERPGRPPAWGGHAWVSAWVGGAWVHVDSALPGVPRTRYLRLSVPVSADRLRTAAALLAGLSLVMGKEITTLP